MRAGPLFHDLKALLETEQPAHIGPESRPGALPIVELGERLDRALKDMRITPSLGRLLRSLVYLWHDHMDESHRIAQEIETNDGSLIHGMLHRREPDYSNAKYWFRRVGSHPSFLTLAIRAGDLLEHRGETDLHSRLLPNKMWDPFAFIDTVEDAEAGQFRGKLPILEEVQKIEFECLLENLVNRV